MKTKIRKTLVIFTAFLMIPAILTANDHITVISQDDYSMILEFTLPPFETENISAPDGIYQRISINRWGMTSETGFPQLPLTGILLQIPHNGATDLQIIEDNYESVPDMNIYPVPRSKISDNGETSYEFEKNSNIYSSSEFYPEVPAETGNQGILRGTHVARLKIRPFRWNPATRELRYSRKMRIQIKFENPLEPATQNRRSKTHDPFDKLKQETIVNYNGYVKLETRNSKLETRRRQSETRLRLEIKQDGIYRLTFSDLSDAGLSPGSIDPETFRIFNSGKEAAIKVESQGDTFSSGDYIEFFGKGIDNHITGTNVYWLYWGESSGKRMDLSDGKVTGQGVEQESFYDTFRTEENNEGRADVVGAPERDYWFWKKLAAHLQDMNVSEHTITLPSPAPSQTGAEVRINFVGYSNTDHHTSVYLNGTQIGSQFWSGTTDYIQKMLISQSLPLTSTLKIELPGDAHPRLDQVWLDWIEIHYWRKFEAVENQLMFIVKGNNWLEISGFTQQDIRIYDITDHDNLKEVTDFSVQDGKATFENLAGISKKYYALGSDQIRKPDSITLRQSANLKSTANGADYIIITAKDFLSSAEPLRQFRENQGLRAVTVSIEDIFDEFSYGLFDPDIIKDFLKYAYENWNPPSPAYVLLVGDANIDYRDYRGSGKINRVPAHFSTTTWDNEPFLTPDDNWHAQVHGDDVYPDMIVGRIPGSSPDMVAQIVSKIINYENNEVYEPHNILLVADNDQEYEETNEDIVRYIPSGFNTDRVYLREYGNVDDATQDIITNIDKGMLITNYVGHGNITNWAGEYLFISSDPGNSSVPSDIDSLSNKDKLTLIISLNCMSGYFCRPTFYSLAEEFIIAEDKGAVACFAPSAFGDSFNMRVLDNEIFSAIFDRDNIIIGSAILQSKVGAYAGWASEDLMKMFNLTGDPATKLKYDVPEPTEIPQLTTEPAGSITTTSATANGNITSFGILNPTQHGFVWSVRQNPSVDSSTKTDSGLAWSAGRYSDTITGLTPDTTYFIRAYATNTMGTGYGDEVEFKTLSAAPKLETLAVGDITSAAATFNGTVTDLGESSPEQHGFVWSTEHEPSVDLSTKTESGTVSATGQFSDSITGLTYETTYYVRAYVSDEQENFYGNEVEFRTLAKQPELPTVETDSVTSLTSATGTGKGNITDPGYPDPDHHGIVWSMEHNPTISLDTKTDFGSVSSAGLFTCSITGLSPDTTYYARAYATNTAGTAYGDEVEFRTLPKLPTVKTGSVSSITTDTAKANGNITDMGNPEPVHHGIIWSTEHNPAVSLSTKTDSGSVSSTGSFSGLMTGLSPNTTYYARAYATNTAGTAYGEEVEFKTLAKPSAPPTVETEPVSNLTATTAQGNGNITDLGYPEPTHHGIVWSAEHNPAVTLSTKTDSGSVSSTGSFSGLMTGLLSGTTYYVRAYAINTVGIVYGEEAEFTTLFVSGDIDADGTVDLKDAILALKTLAGDKQELADIRADVNGDEKIDFADAVYVLQYVIGERLLIDY
ncbi:MAG: hypothetical protein GY749_01605 [Desulfobacteraceae bacterium]|nr:hypothetical protein [Desulfobacteraceae bacterium]